MRRFVFSMEGVLRQRQWKEDEARRILGLEMGKLALLNEELESLGRAVASNVQQRSVARGLTPLQHLYFISYGHKLEKDMAEKKVQIEEQKKIILKKTELLNHAMLERKKFEKFKERNFERYRVYKRRKDASVMDEAAANFTRDNGSSPSRQV